jgi:hypothetical protein
MVTLQVFSHVCEGEVAFKNSKAFLLILILQVKDYNIYALYINELKTHCYIRHCNDNCLNV